MKFILVEENELEKRAKFNKSTDKKGAKGWFVHPNPGDPEAIKRFNDSVAKDAKVPTGATADGGVGEVSAASSGGATSVESLQGTTVKEGIVGGSWMGQPTTRTPQWDGKEYKNEFEYNGHKVMIYKGDTSYNYYDLYIDGINYGYAQDTYTIKHNLDEIINAMKPMGEVELELNNYDLVKRKRDKYGKTVFMDECLDEDTVKTKKGWTNKGDDGETHGTFTTKKQADAQRKAMFANGYKGGK